MMRKKLMLPIKKSKSKRENELGDEEEFDDGEELTQAQLFALKVISGEMDVIKVHRHIWREGGIDDKMKKLYKFLEKYKEVIKK